MKARRIFILLRCVLILSEGMKINRKIFFIASQRVNLDKKREKIVAKARISLKEYHEAAKRDPLHSHDILKSSLSSHFSIFVMSRFRFIIMSWNFYCLVF
jgi:hypothetical protein